MKLRTVFLIFLISFFLLGIFVSNIIRLEFRQENFKDQVGNYLVSSVFAKGERIDDCFEEIGQDVAFLSDSERVKDVFREELGDSGEAAILDVSGKSYIVAKEIENYLKAHPDMTLNDLKKSGEFVSIAVRKVGAKGYSLLQSANEKEFYLHVDPAFIGLKAIDFILEFPRLKKIFEGLDTRGESAGFYSWRDEDGLVYEKYGEFKDVGVRTSDNEELVSAITTYVHDYRVANVSSALGEYFWDFNNIKGYHNVLFISPEGRIVYMANAMRGLGLRVEDLNEDLLKIYRSGLELDKEGVGFFGPFFGHMKNDGLQFAVYSKVYDYNDFLGIFVIVDNMDEVNSILESRVEGVEEEVYLINNDSLLLTEMGSRDVDVLVQKIDTESSKKCFERLRDQDVLVMGYGDVRSLDTFSFLDFKGDMVFGLDFFIEKLDWCLLSEVNVNNVLIVPLKEDVDFVFNFRHWSWWILIFGIIVASFFVDSNFILVKRKSFVFEKIMTRLRSTWFGGISFSFALVLSAVFAIFYFFLVISFFQGWSGVKLFDSVPDLFIFTIGFLFVHYSLKSCPRGICNFIFFGGLFISLGRAFEIPFQEYQQILGYALNWIVWAPVLILNFFGVLFLLLGFRRLKNGL